MGKKNKKNKKVAELKTKEERLSNVVEVLKKIKDLGLSKEIPGIKEFYRICNDYVHNTEPVNGKIKLNGFKRELIYILPSRKGINPTINLRFDENI
tara:strand:+ start:398 stop:685 length:288 start_codon:yes stop_codon:yes gene_type:complete